MQNKCCDPEDVVLFSRRRLSFDDTVTCAYEGKK
jgi:hypothetical protein